MAVPAALLKLDMPACIIQCMLIICAPNCGFILLSAVLHPLLSAFILYSGKRPRESHPEE